MPIRLIFAIPDHPWADEGAAVRIAMTVAELDNVRQITKNAQLGTVISEAQEDTPEKSAEKISVVWESVGKLFSDLRAIADTASTVLLKGNENLSSTGVKLHGSGQK